MNAVCTMCRNETPYINEWVNWHLSIGFDKIFIYNDDVVDPTTVISKSCLSRVEIIQVENGDSGSELHRRARTINDFIQRHSADVEWCAFIDVDEFIHTNKPVGEWLAAAPADVECMALKWHLYGDDGVIDGDESKLVQSRFVKCIDDKFEKNGLYLNHMCKKVIKLKADITADDMFIFRRNGEPISMYDSDYATKWRCAVILPTNAEHCCYINHYVTKSLKECLKYKCGDLWGIRLEDYYFMFNERTAEKEEYFK